MLEVCNVGDVEIHVVIHVYKVRCGNRSAIGVENATVYVIFDCPCEKECRVESQRVAPLYLVKDGMVL